MENRAWANTAELRRLVGKAEAYGASEWTLSSEESTRAFVEAKENAAAVVGPGGAAGAGGGAGNGAEIQRFTMTLERVDGRLAVFAGCGGFRKYCKASADQHGVTGYIQGVLNRDMKIVFEGSRAQCQHFHNFLKICRQQGMIGALTDITRETSDDTFYGEFTIL